MPIVAKEGNSLVDRYAKRFRDALDISDRAVFAVHQRITHNEEFYIEVFGQLSAKDRAQIKDAIGRCQVEQPDMLANGRRP